MNTFPLFFKLENQPVAIVGGGEVAQRKADLLRRAGADLTIIAPKISAQIHALLGDDKQQTATVDTPAAKHQLICADYDKKWLVDKRLVIAATDDQALNEQIYQDAKALNIPVNVVDTPHLCDFIFPAIVDRSPIVIGISSNGQAPVLARLLRARLETLIPQSYGKLAKLAGNLRAEVKAKIPTLTGRRQFWERAFEGKVSELMFAGREALAESTLRQDLAQLQHSMDNSTQATQSASTQGEVYIVGTGPGDAELLTFKALRLMQQADIVYYDALVSPQILDLCRRDADKVYVGKKRSEHALAQQDLNQCLVDNAQKGKRVVRLKGGDPFVFGRGGEEIQTLQAAGVYYQVVPGITAANAAACYTGIPLTHRDHAQSVKFVSGFLKAGEPNTNFAELLDPEQTVVFYMGLSALKRLTRGLIEAGKPADTAIAIISHASLPNQQVLTGTLTNIVAKQADANLPTPAVIIMGDVVNLHQTLAWYGDDIAKLTQQAHALNMV